MKKLLPAILAPALTLLTGCFVVPVENAGHKDYISGFLLPLPASPDEVVSGTRILPAEVSFVRPGQTSRAQITNTFSQPWAYYPDMDVMVYYWESVDWHWLGGVSDNCISITGSADTTSLHYWFVKLDRTDLVEKHGFIRASPNTPTRKIAERWIKGKI